MEVKFKKIYNGKYEVSSDGRIFSYARGKRKELRCVNCLGYGIFCLRINGKNMNVSAHRLGAKAFIPNLKNLPQINHIDCNKLNNNVKNLEWCTAKQNQIHARDNGLRPSVKINMKIANKIRMIKKVEKITNKKLGVMFNLDESEISRIINKKIWIVERPGVAKIDMLTTNKIRTIYRDGDYSQNELARIFEISQSTISCIVRNKFWKI